MVKRRTTVRHVTSALERVAERAAAIDALHRLAAERAREAAAPTPAPTAPPGG